MPTDRDKKLEDIACKHFCEHLPGDDSCQCAPIDYISFGRKAYDLGRESAAKTVATKMDRLAAVLTPHIGHTRDCTTNLPDTNPESDFCDCGLREHRIEANELAAAIRRGEE